MNHTFKRSLRTGIAAGLLLSLAASAMASLPFLWLDTPTRSNAHDPKSPLFAPAVVNTMVVPTNTPVVPSTPTPTSTISPTSTWTLTNTPQLTATPTNTNSPAFTSTNTPTVTPSRTNTPFLSPTSTPSVTQTQTTALNTPSVTATFTPIVTSSLVADFENNATNDRSLWGGGVFTGHDTGYTPSTTMAQDPWGPTSGTAPGNGSGYAARISGTMVQQNYTGVPSYVWSYADLAVELTPGGNGGGAGAPTKDLTGFYGVKFDYKMGAGATTGEPYRFAIHDKGTGNYYEYQFTPADNNWHTVTVYFPGMGTTPTFVQPGAVTAFDITKIGGFQIEPVQDATRDINYDISIDNIDLGIPAPPPTPTAVVTPGYTNTGGFSIMNFDDPTQNNVTSPVNFGWACFTGGSGTITNWAAGSGNNPGSPNSPDPAGTYCGQITGNIGAGQYALWEFWLASNGYQNSTDPGFVVTNTIAPNHRIIFDYKAGASGVGIPFSFAIVGKNFPNPSYNWYEYIWTPADTNWHTLVVYFPDATASFTPRFAQSYGAASTWDVANTGIGEIYIKPRADGSTGAFDISIDEMRFD